MFSVTRIQQEALRADSPDYDRWESLGRADLERNTMHTERAAVFWDFPEWLEGHGRFGWEFVDYLPIVLRNEIGNYSLALRYRSRPTIFIRDLFRYRRGEPHPNEMVGGMLRHQVDDLDRHIQPDDDWSKIESRLLIDGKYHFLHEKADMLIPMIALAKEKGVPLVFVELPSHAKRSEAIAGTYPEFQARIHEIAERRDIPYLSLARLEVEFPLDTDWRDSTHLHLRGALRFSRAVAAQLPVESVGEVRADYRYTPREESDLSNYGASYEGFFPRCYARFLEQVRRSP